MSNTSGLLRTHLRTVVVCGCIGHQASQIRSLTKHLGVKLIVMTPEELLKRRSLNPDLVVLTRFVGHKHTKKARAITGAPVRIVYGTASAVSELIVMFCSPSLLR